MAKQKQPTTDQPPCLCGTGAYCHKHARYAKSDRTQGADQWADEREVTSLEYERCGGGRRIIRKSVGNY